MSETMTKTDYFWLCMDDPTNLMIISGFMEFDRPLDYGRLCRHFEQRLCKFDRFKQYPANPISGVGIPNWEFDPHFDIRSHVHRVALPGPGGQKELQEMTSDLMTLPLEQTKPMWQAHLIENYKDGCAVFFRIHHCIADGIALIYVLLSTTETEPTAEIANMDISEKKRKKHRSLLPIGSLFTNFTSTLQKTQRMGKKFASEINQALKNPDRIKEIAQFTSAMSYDFVTVLGKLTMMPFDPKTSFKGKLGVRKKVAWTTPMDLGDIKKVSQSVEATLNDVLIATVAGALRRYLKMRNDKINDLELRVAVPVNIRKPGTEFELGNKFSLVFLSLPVHIEDPVLRLKEVKRRMDELKKSPDAVVGFLILNAMGFSPAKMVKTASKFFANKATAVLTNVPGPRQHLYFAGGRINNMMFWVPRTGRVGLGISILSYAGQVTVGLAADERLVPDPEILLEGFEEDFAYLFDLVKEGKVFTEPLVINDRYRETQEFFKKQAKKNKITPSAENKTDDVKTTAKCAATNRAGNPCMKKPKQGSQYCSAHQPKKEAEK